jgi:Uma2 family endonuclease
VVTTAARTPGKKTIADWLAQPEELRLELIDGELVEKALPDEPHSDAQTGLIGELRPAFNRRGGGGRPGGWWIRAEIDIQLGGHGFRPDVAGWRRESVPQMPRTRPVTIRPDWICEILSESNATTDTVKKLRRYHQAGVPHYWILDPMTQSLTVYRHQAEGYLNVLVAEKGETVRAEPFEAIELRIGLLFGEDPDDPPAAKP